MANKYPQVKRSTHERFDTVGHAHVLLDHDSFRDILIVECRNGKYYLEGAPLGPKQNIKLKDVFDPHDQTGTPIFFRSEKAAKAAAARARNEYQRLKSSLALESIADVSSNKKRGRI